jgi:hypothetical protein
MDADRFDTLSRTLGTPVPRRGTLAALLGGTLGLRGLTETTAKHKKKHEKPCPTCATPPVCPGPPSPPPAPYCAGKNTCARFASYPCEASGPACFCFLQADTATTFCGRSAPPVTDCASCTAGQVCAVLGGVCAGRFMCSDPCPNPL